MKEINVVLAETDEERRNHDDFHAFMNMDGSLTEQGEILTDFALRLLAKACFVNSFNHGWYEPYMNGDEIGQRNFGEVIALINSEAAEAFEEYRNGDDQTKIYYSYASDSPKQESPDGITVLGKPEGIASELADIFIRTLDYVGAYNVPLAEALIQKHKYNLSRPYRHGNKKA